MATPLTLEDAFRALQNDTSNTDHQRALALLSGDVKVVVSTDFLREDVKAATLETLNTALFPRIKALRERAKAQFNIDMPPLNFLDDNRLPPCRALVTVGTIIIWEADFPSDAAGLSEETAAEIFGVLENIFTIDRFQIFFGYSGGESDRAVVYFAKEKLLAALNDFWQWRFAERGLPAQKTRIRNDNSLAPQEFAVLIDGIEVWRKRFSSEAFTARADAAAEEIIDVLAAYIN